MSAHADRDSIHRFVFEKHHVRGELVRLNASWAAVLDGRDYAPAARRVLGEALAAAALLTSTLKFEGRLIIQLHGDGVLSMLVAECTSRMNVRGLLHWRDDQATAPDAALSDLAGTGRLAITIDPQGKGRRYQGVVPLEGATMAACVERYFERSEQLPTRLWLVADGDSVVGMLLQKLPAPGDAPKTHRVDDDAWNRLTILADTLTAEEMLTLGDRDILHRLFHEEDVRLFEAAPVSFRCTCSRERIAGALRGLGRAEIDAIAAEQGEVATTCEFCNKRYVFDPVDVAALFENAAPGASGVQH